MEAHAPPDPDEARPVAPRLRRLALVLRVGELGGLVLYLIALAAPGNRPAQVITGVWGMPVLIGLAAAVGLVRAVILAEDRRAWLAMGVGIGTYAVANIVWTLLGSPPGASVADVLFLAMYPCLYIGLVWLARARTQETSRGRWLDGLIGGLGATAVSAAFFFQPILDSARSLDGAGMAVNLAYPVADLLLIMVVFAALGPIRFRPDRALLTVSVGLAVLAAGDTLFLFQSATDSYHAGSFVDATWIISTVLIAEASWLRPGRTKQVVGEKNGVMAVPISAVIASIVVLIVGRTSSVATLAIGLAVATLAMATLRMALAFGELRQLAQSRLEARTDDLTGLGNRRRFGELIHAAERDDEQSTAVLLLDLDGFKDVNDSLGHLAGDELLVEIANRLRRAVPAGAALARLGGDEFGVLLEGTTLRESRYVADDIHHVLSFPITVDGLDVRVDASIGLALVPDNVDSEEHLLRCADVAMYTAKHDRKGTAVYDQNDDPNSRAQLATLNQLREGIGRGELVLHLQPKVSLTTGEVTGAEALVRWAHPDRGVLGPDQFLPLAERANLMPAITRAVLATACGHSRALLEAGHALPVSVNVSPGDLLDQSFPDQVLRVMLDHHLPPQLLLLEITEGSLIAEPERAARALNRLRETGVRIALDDFGVGFSSLHHLRMLPIDELKLDRSLTFDVTTDQRSRSVVGAITQLAHALQLHLVVEGVEDSETMDALCELGCDDVQGYFISRPLAPELFLSWLDQRRATRSRSS